eukprot:NODE_1864_length_876_cov_260.911729_g1299_i0.p3 GENE.NODE_1864_length_876_cov_260.911729_g1299_i0~~NODE_1864_length_876_cov_260.911729_g1299_i0.p3  ORF type:complete len:80 (+),score=42.59 NODE_1864_length_876_cov_260.911729_g1299_i0:31-240(+)
MGVCVGKDTKEALAHFWAAVEFMQHQLDNTGVDDHQTNFGHIAAACRALNQDRVVVGVPSLKKSLMPRS